MESLELYIFLTEFKNNQILLNKISHKFLLTTKLFTWQKNLTVKHQYSDKDHDNNKYLFEEQPSRETGT